MEKLRRRTQGEGGFTLIELLVVIVIIGILAAVVVFAVGGINDKGQDSACEADERTLATAEEAFFADTDVDPPLYGSEQALVDAGFLQDLSSLHSITLVGGGTSYTIAETGDCL
jgi:general secretion pathway protein G